MTRAEIDTKIATLRLTITLADGVCESAYQKAEENYDNACVAALDVQAAAEREADLKFEKIRDEAEAEIARLEGLEVTE